MGRLGDVKLQAAIVVVVSAVLLASAVAFLVYPPERGVTSSSSGSSSSESISSSRIVISSGCAPRVTSTGWTTYHGDNSRDGYSAQGVSCTSPEWKSAALDGKVYAEPLVYQGMTIVATENDSVYALNATSGSVLWRAALGKPMPGSALPCGDINPSGITGTPAIDPSTGTLYAVTFEAPGNHYLVAVSLSDGSVRFRESADPAGADPLVEQQRGALSLANGLVYIPFGGLAGDCGAYHGWVVGIRADGSGSVFSYQVPTSREGGIWAPSGAAVAPSGEVFVATGNSASTGTFDFGDAVIGLTQTLRQADYFAASNWSALNQGDTDLGSVGPLLLSDGEIFQIGKEGVGYLLNATSLGGIDGQVFSGQVCSGAYGGDASAGSLVFVPCSDGLVALSATMSSFTTLWHTPSYSAGPPVVTGGIVWALDTGDGTLQGYDVHTGVLLFQYQTSEVTRFTTPSVGDGRLFVAAGDEVFSFILGS